MADETKWKRGFYMTNYGNTAFVSGGNPKSAYDVDMGERVPITLVVKSKFVRTAKTRRD